MSQEEMDQCWKNLAEGVEVEVLDKYMVEDSKREAHRGRGSPLEWSAKKQKMGNNFPLFREQNLQRLQSMHEDWTEEGQMKRSSSMKRMKDMTKKIGST